MSIFSFAKPLEGLVIGKGALVPPLPPDSGPTSANRRNAIRVLAEVVGPDELFSICNYNCSEITDKYVLTNVIFKFLLILLNFSQYSCHRFLTNGRI